MTTTGKPAFVQIIEMDTKDLDAYRSVESEWRAAAGGRATLRRHVLTRDLHKPGHYVNLLFFDSYELAMENSELPETKANAERMRTVIDGSPVYRDLEVIEEIGS